MKLFKMIEVDHLATSEESSWFTEPTCVDAVVFVHGIIGDQVGTWGLFPSLLENDIELPKLDILHWGYRSGKRPSNYLGVAAESKGLISDLSILLQDGEPIHIVAHSMGGLVTMRGITDEIAADLAARHPVNTIGLVTLYATPLNGSSAADVISGLADRYAPIRWLSRRFNKTQLDDLRTAGFVETLTDDIESHVEVVDVHEEAMERALTVQVITGKRDKLVTHESGVGPFKDTNPPPKVLEGTHQTVKLPMHHNDVRYRALKKNLEKKLAMALQQHCNAALSDSATEAERSATIGRIVEQYQKQLEIAFTAIIGRYITDQERLDVLRLFLEYGTEDYSSPQVVVTRTIAFFRFGGLLSDNGLRS